MPKRNPNRPRKSSRKSGAKNTIPDMHYHGTANGQTGYQPYNMATFTQPGYWYTYTHPVTREDVVVWYDGRYADTGEEYYLYGGGGGGNYHEESQQRFSPPLYRYIEGYHDPILEDQTDHWWRLFGHDVPAQFILAPIKTPGHGEVNEDDGQAEEATRLVEGGGSEGKWDAAAYFGPYRMLFREPSRGLERAYGEENGNGKDRREEGGNCADGSTTRGPIDSCKREHRGRADWECDFCGMECFCWTVDVKVTEV
ncbi:hypothetical protein BKA58DRAFT_449278 [Alternaria rosae]|uniref:uncharacterized protein n=1 Tax=Alternaria rosae TaxID=1187941 RepID=UPI001E8CC4B8|nr:uncharacterized protein BKA58DRAFT_449278 [Alternaria rosae]KAH6858921.1 hypothetical protein BKA58DRAFT_449278 [Alternaria rosae]